MYENKRSSSECRKYDNSVIMLQDFRVVSGLYKTLKVVYLLINIGGKLRNFLVNNIVCKKYFQRSRTEKNRVLGNTEFCAI